MMKQCLALLCDEQAATAVEYAVMLGLILTAIITAIAGVGLNTGSLIGSSSSQMAEHGLGL